MRLRNSSRIDANLQVYVNKCRWRIDFTPKGCRGICLVLMILYLGLETAFPIFSLGIPCVEFG